MLLRRYATRAVRKDPWARLETWREGPELKWTTRLSQTLPGLTWGFYAFLVLATIDELYWKPKQRREEAEWKRKHPHH